MPQKVIDKRLKRFQQKSFNLYHSRTSKSPEITFISFEGAWATLPFYPLAQIHVLIEYHTHLRCRLLLNLYCKSETYVYVSGFWCDRAVKFMVSLIDPRNILLV